MEVLALCSNYFADYLHFVAENRCPKRLSCRLLLALPMANPNYFVQINHLETQQQKQNLRCPAAVGFC